MASNETPPRAPVPCPGRGPSATILAFAAIVALGSSPEVLAGDEAEFFEKKVRPILVDRCYRCHNAARKQGGGLALDTRAGWVKGGDSGPAIRPGDPEASPLLKAVRWADESLPDAPRRGRG